MLSESALMPHMLHSLFVAAVSFLVPGLQGPLALGVPLYTAVLVTMLWRAVAQVTLPW